MLVCIWFGLYRVFSYSRELTGSVQFSWMLVGIWLGLYWVLFSFFDHYVQSSAGLLGGRRREWGLGFTGSLVVFVYVLVPPFWESMHLGLTFQL